MNKKTFVSLSLITVFVVIIFSLISHQPNSSSQKNIEAKKQLNIALVNEDQGYEAHQQVYLLGTQYINSLKDTKDKRYEVVNRGLAEHGLKNHDYDLVIYIPTTFSQTIMEFDKKHPEQLDLNYKIQANNKDEATTLTKTAQKIIKDLNKKLTTIYTLGLLDSLYTAKKDAGALYLGQEQLANTYQKTLSAPIGEVSQSLPNIFDMTTDLAKENDSLNNEYQQYQKEQAQLFTQQVEETKQALIEATTPLKEQIESLTQEREDLVNYMMELDYNELLQTQKELTANLQTLADEMQQTLALDEDDYEALFASYQKLVVKGLEQVQKDLVTKQKQLTKTLEQLKHDNNQAGMTVEEYLQICQPDLLKAIKETCQQPNIDTSQILKWTYDKELFKYFTHPEQIEHLINDLNKYQTEFQLEVQDNAEELQKLKDYNKQLANLEQAQKQKYTEEISVDLSGMTDDDTFTFELLNDVQLGDFAAKNPNLVLGKLSDTKYQVKLTKDVKKVIIPVAFSYDNFDDKDNYQLVKTTFTRPEIEEKFVGKPKVTTHDSNTSSSSDDTITHDKITINNTHSISNKQTLEHFQTLKTVLAYFADYQKQVLKNYQTVLTAFQKVSKQQSGLQKLLSIKLNADDLSLLMKFVDEDLLALQAKQEKLTAYQEQLQEAEDALMQKLPQIKEQNQKLSSLLDDLVAKLTELEQKIDNAKEFEIPQLQEVELPEMAEDVTNLTEEMTQTSDLVKSDNDLFKSVDQAKQEFTQKGDKLAQSSADLQKEFQKELQKNNDFTTSFMKVLNNGYQNGVPNEDLMDFIVNPLNSQGSETIASKIKTYPYQSWLLCLLLVAFLISMIVKMSQIQLKKLTFSKYQNQVQHNIWQLVMLMTLSLIFGSLLSYVGANIFFGFTAIWLVTNLLLILVLSSLGYLALEYGGKFGLAAYIVLIVIYILSYLKQIPYLNFFGYFDQILKNMLTPRIYFDWSMLIISILLCLVLLIFLPKPKGMHNNEAT